MLIAQEPPVRPLERGLELVPVRRRLGEQRQEAVPN
jgi:hypothetical protein